MRNLMPFIGVIIIVTALAVFALYILSIIGISPFAGCYYRYSDLNHSSINTSSIKLMANANYVGTNCAGQENCPPSEYGQWTKVNLRIKSGARVSFNVSGSVSLCQAYTLDGTKTPIPRVGNNSPGLPITLVASATTTNLINTYMYDKVQVSVGNNLNNSKCPDGQTLYDASCGRYSFLVGSNYLQQNDCEVKNPSDCGDNNSRDKVCTNYPLTAPDQLIPNNCTSNGIISSTRIRTCAKCSASGSLPQAYSSNSIFSYHSNSASSDQSNITSIINNYNPCPAPNSTIQQDFQCPTTPNADSIKSWLTFDISDSGQNSSSGLYYSEPGHSSFDTMASALPDDDKKSPTTYSNRYIYNNKSVNSAGQLRYQFYQGPPANYTGGYTLYIKQTKCFRENGAFFTDTDDSTNKGCADRGQVKYLILTDGQNPNSDPSLANNTQALPVDGRGNFQPINPNTNGWLWLRINNNAQDYQNSTGFYSVLVTQTVAAAPSNQNDPWNWITDLFINKWQGISSTIFQNISCYGANPTSCINFFNVIKACLIGYIIIFGAMFALGSIKISNIDLIVRVVKVVLVSGLMNEKTFDFFSCYIFPLVFQATNQIMSSIYGVGATMESSLSNFFSSIYSMLIADIFQIQLLALLGTGLSGVMFLILVIISLILFLIPVFEFVVIYLLASVLVAILMSLAPIFLVFLLFENTRHLFDNWFRFTINYIFEPVIMFIGISCLSKLFLIYIDYVLSFSVCWKCVLSFQIPFLDKVFPFLGDLNTVPIFCIYWLAPWGYDPLTYNFAMNLTNVIALFIISFTTLRYANLSAQICTKIFGRAGGASLTSSVSSFVSSSAVSILQSMKAKAQSGSGSSKGRNGSKRSYGASNTSNNEGSNSNDDAASHDSSNRDNDSLKNQSLNRQSLNRTLIPTQNNQSQGESLDQKKPEEIPKSKR